MAAAMKAKREREEACSICGHYHDVSGERGGWKKARRAGMRGRHNAC